MNKEQRNKFMKAMILEGSNCSLSFQSPENQVSISGTSRPTTPQSKLPKRFVPIYRGESKAMCIQLFCIDEQFEMR